MGLTVFPNGVLATPNLGGPGGSIPPTTGKIWFVDSNAGGRQTGKTPSDAFLTLAAAVSAATASKGDQIWVMPGHAESIAAATTISKAGLQIYGLGTGDNRPTFTFTTATTAKFSLTGAGIVFKNCRLVCGIDAQAIMLSLGATNITVEDCYFQMADASYQAVSGIDILGAATFHRIINCYFKAMVIGAEEAIHIASDAVTGDGEIKNCRIDGTFTNAPLYSARASTNENIVGNVLHNFVGTASAVVKFTAAQTGFLAFNAGYCKAATAGVQIDPGSMWCLENYVTKAIDVSGILTPATS